MRFALAVATIPLLVACTPSPATGGSTPSPTPTPATSGMPEPTPTPTPTPASTPSDRAAPTPTPPAASSRSTPASRATARKGYYYKYDKAGIPLAVCRDTVSGPECQAWTPPPASDWPDDPAHLVDANGRVSDPNPRRTFPPPTPIPTRTYPTGPCPAGTSFSGRKGRCVTYCEEFPSNLDCRTSPTSGPATTSRATRRS